MHGVAACSTETSNPMRNIATLLLSVIYCKVTSNLSPPYPGTSDMDDPVSSQLLSQLLNQIQEKEQKIQERDQKIRKVSTVHRVLMKQFILVTDTVLPF